MSSSTDRVSAARIFSFNSSGQEFPLPEGMENSLPALVQLGQLLQAVANGRNLHFIQGACDLLPVTGDEGMVAPSAINSAVA